VSESVLIIDDERLFRTLVADHLAKEGYRVLAAAGGEEGLKTLAAEPVHVVLLDLIMPGLDGMEVLRRIKRDRPELPVIITTGFASMVPVVESMGLGPAACLVKPFPLDDLRAAIDAAR